MTDTFGPEDPRPLSGRAVEYDPLHEQLNALHGEVDRLRFVPPSLVRARGRARSRRQVALVAGAVVLVAGVGYLGRGGSLLQTRLQQPPAATPSDSPAASPSRSTSPSGVPSSSGNTALETATATPYVISPGGGPVPPAYYLPARLWAGADLDHGAPTGFVEPYDPEGRITVHECDSAVDAVGPSAFLNVAELEPSRPIGIQRVQLLGSAAEAARAVAAAAAALSHCQVPPDANYSVAVTQRTAVAAGAGAVGGHLLLARVRTTTLDTKDTGTEWVAWVSSDNGPAVSTLVLRQPPAGQVGWDSLQRLAAATLRQLDQAQRR
jgi:hypothetical protein